MPFVYGFLPSNASPPSVEPSSFFCCFFFFFNPNSYTFFNPRKRSHWHHTNEHFHRLTAPGAPQAPKVTKITARTAVVTWKVPTEHNGAPITSFTVLVRATESEEVREIKGIEGDKELVSVGDLLPNTEYQFSVAATNAAGQGDFSPASEPQHTLPAGPSKLDSPPVASKVLIDSLQLNWDPPTDDNGSPVIGYRVSYQVGGAGPYEVLIANTNTTETRADVKDLEANTVYKFRVMGINAVGVGEESDPSAPAITATSAPSKIAETPRVHNIASTSVVLVWSPPKDNGFPITNYIITRKTGGEEEFMDPVTTPSNAVVATVDGLMPGTQYSFRVVALNTLGRGPESEPTTPITTLAALPGQVATVTVAVVNGTAVNLHWTPAEGNGANVTSYSVLAQDRSDGPYNTVPASKITMDPDGRGALIHDLRAEAWYSFRVAAVNSVGVGPPSEATKPVQLPLERVATPTPAPALALAPGTEMVAFLYSPNPFELGRCTLVPFFALCAMFYVVFYYYNYFYFFKRLQLCLYSLPLYYICMDSEPSGLHSTGLAGQRKARVSVRIKQAVRAHLSSDCAHIRCGPKFL